MCGICGVIGFDNPNDSESLVRRMNAAMVHRGPDAEGLLVAPRATLGMRRLSIIDLPGGGQPVWNEAGTLAIVFNGEIYNYRELRPELESLGHTFQTNSDTETIVHAYESWGADCVSRLRGMFTLAIAEMPSGRGGEVARVFLARDRFGIKPLYFAIADGKLVFASEVRALLASGLVARKLSAAAVASYVLFGAVGEPTTLIEGVASLPPGHSLLIDANSPAAASPKPYWNLDTAKSAEPSRNGNTSGAPKHLRALLEDAVQKHLIADVPIGVFLSSGIDSTALTALASQQRSGLHTFTLIFPEREFSEAEIARRTAKRFHTDHKELLISGDEMLGRIDEAIAAFDQPSMDGINTYFVSWAARQAGLKVALSGLGSDEIFGGYSTFRTAPQLARLAKWAQAAPAGLRRATAPMVEAFGGSFSHGDAGRKLASAWADPEFFPNAYFLTRALFPPEQAAALLSQGPESWRDAGWSEWLKKISSEADTLEGASKIAWLELRSYMVNVLLRDTDSMSMSHSLEVRVPFLDHPVVEFALSLSDAAKCHSERPKALLVAALADLLPDEVVSQNKRTFTLPWETWLRGALRTRVTSGLADWSPSLEPVISKAAALKVWNDFLDARTSWSRAWSLYVLNEWVKRTCSLG
ncbi:MAG: asparagine synthase (glutamine-hydrolyzing) [Candidatus Acidiferrales bacterium]|jgi:asparagine synthase (glutamine-hydrolysing)